MPIPPTEEVPVSISSFRLVWTETKSPDNVTGPGPAAVRSRRPELLRLQTFFLLLSPTPEGEPGPPVRPSQRTEHTQHGGGRARPFPHRSALTDFCPLRSPTSTATHTAPQEPNPRRSAVTVRSPPSELPHRRTTPRSPSQNGSPVLRRLTLSPSSPFRGAAGPQPMGARRPPAPPMGAEPRLLPGGPGAERPRRAGGRGRHLNPLTKGSAGAAAALCPARPGPARPRRPAPPAAPPAPLRSSTAPRIRCESRPARELARQKNWGTPAPAAAGGFKS